MTSSRKATDSFSFVQTTQYIYERTTRALWSV